MVSDVSHSSTSSPKEGRGASKEFIRAVQIISTSAHARLVDNGWGGQPIPNLTDIPSRNRSLIRLILRKLGLRLL